MPQGHLHLSLCPLHTITVPNGRAPAQQGELKVPSKIQQIEKKQWNCLFIIIAITTAILFQCMNPMKVPGEAEHIF